MKKQQRKQVTISSFVVLSVIGFVVSCRTTEKQAHPSSPVRIMACGDLALTSLLAKSSAGLGTSMIITDTTANVHATCTSTVTTTAFWLSASSNGSSICTIGSHSVQALPPGSNWVKATTVTICGATTGSLWLVGIADRDKKTSDSNYGNNTNSRAITITP